MSQIYNATLTENEMNYIKGVGFWAKNRVDEIEKSLAKREEMRIKEEQYETPIRIFVYSVIAKKLNKVLHDWYDIVALFGEEFYFKRFINFLFDRATSIPFKGVLPIVFERGYYIIDYNYLLMMIEKWGIEEFNLDEDNFALFMKNFHYSIGEHLFNTRGLYLIKSVFAMHGTMIAKHINDNEFYTPSIVVDREIEKFYYMGIPFIGSAVLRYLDREIVEYLFNHRDNFRLKQTVFGKASLGYKDSSKIFCVN